MTEKPVPDKIGVALVDDDEAVLNSLKIYLERRGLTVTTFTNAQELLDAVDSGEQFDCVVTDVRMPGMSGVELQSALARRNCVWPLILITGHGDVGMAVSALKAGAADFIEKPTDDQRLLASIGDAVTAARARTREQVELTGIGKRYEELSDRQREVMSLRRPGNCQQGDCGEAWDQPAYRRTLSRACNGAHAGKHFRGTCPHGRTPRINR